MEVKELLADEAPFLLGHECLTIPRADLALPGPDFIDRVLALSDRPPS
jgi:class I fructose-bisphosphate aldolase